MLALRVTEDWLGCRMSLGAQHPVLRIRALHSHMCGRRAPLHILYQAHDSRYIKAFLQSVQQLREPNKPAVFAGATNSRQRRRLRPDGETPASASTNAQVDAGDEDTVIVANAGGGSLAAALKSAGAACQAVDLLFQARAINAFCCVRPPGHHAGTRKLVYFTASCLDVHQPQGEWGCQQLI